ncbi:hypothetical protein TRIUR3_34659 [Triticum urartu]|uniref:Uncharacterized protein n=1 Tax=Triticum urartu TaxID=4572 RepID=M7ZID2_TRIUA|nr:hypothetical protein TRIUR3_34659 [Triticum urartu]
MEPKTASPPKPFAAHKVFLRACLRWINSSRPDLKRGCFSQQEEDHIVALHRILGNRLIADRVLSSDLLHYVWFRAVCKQWRANTLSPRGCGMGNGLHPGHPALGGYICFLNIYTGIFIRVHLPCFEDHSVLDCPDGLLLLQRKKDAVICLLHLPLPPSACT